MTRITNDFDDTTTAAEVVAGIDLSGRTAIVTGAASGIGVETARALADAGASVTLAVRDTKKGEEVRADIVESTKNDDVAVSELDLADLRSVEAFVASWEGPLHILVNNAGVMDTPETYTDNGWELQFATNHLATSPSRRACTTRSPPRTPGSSSSAPAAMVNHRSSSRTSSSTIATTSPGSPTVSPRRPTRSSRSRRHDAGPTTASPPTR